ncbi:WSCD family member CG9164-like [Paramacrobiotus metropolitanus]|uniref:WSCD family member CG9164-like n=1 Tax=Paramacrobiotus metropolitanus TaxID=2943436 RepID=UPI002445C5F2|nr:WSCD family member CG9164-like [Paramacrobiotus metropolitanus]
MVRARMTSTADGLTWSEFEEAGLIPDEPAKGIPLSYRISMYREKVRFFLKSSLSQIRCKWFITALMLCIIAGAGLLSTLPLIRMRLISPQEEGPIGPELDPKMRPCRKILNFSPTPLPKIALASFTGSGNTYLRGAIEQITGIWTGSAVPDFQLYHGGFYGEVTADSKVIVVKTHGYGKKATKANYKKVILLVRKPEDAILAKWNQYKTRTHTGIAQGDSYDTEEWRSFVPKSIEEWKEMNEYWLSQNPVTVHVVQFEELLTNKKEELLKVIDFLGFKDQLDENMLNCVVEKYEGLFRRRKFKMDFEPYTPEMKEQIENARDLVQQAVEEWKFSKFDSVEWNGEDDAAAAP